MSDCKSPCNPCAAKKKPMMDRQGMKMVPAEPNRAFAAILPALKKTCRGGRHFVADGRWVTWKNFAKHPHAGGTHGGRHLVNYANPAAARVYGATMDWRHALILPGGRTHGVTKGPNGDKVAFCMTVTAVRRKPTR